MTRARAWLGVIGVLVVACASVARGQTVTVGSKKFTESVILGEIATQVGRVSGVETEHLRELGDPQILFAALRAGDLDVYPEYTGTLRLELLAGEGVETTEQLRAALDARGLRMTSALGFNNTYAIGMLRTTAERLGVRRISDLRTHPGLALGFGNEFMDREDGWPSLRLRYGLPHENVRGLDHDLGYQALLGGSIGAMDLYSTDAEIAHYGLAVLDDDLEHFPRYDAVLLYRADLEERHPAFVEALRRLEGAIGESAMVSMNQLAKIGRGTGDDAPTRVPEAVVASEFLGSAFGMVSAVRVESRSARVLARTLEHLWLVAVSLGAAILIGVPLGVAASHRPRLGQVILGAVGIVQTIPSLALLVVLIRPLGLGDRPAIAALFVYSLLPIVRNAHAGLRGVPGEIVESAEALGLSRWDILRLVELPMASASILAGIKTAAVLNIGFATLGALIGAGGYGQPIVTGIRLNDFGLILEGVIPAAGMAVGAQALFELVERFVVPRGLRLKSVGGP